MAEIIPEGRDIAVDTRNLANVVVANLRRTSEGFGGIELDSKKPFGNSAVEADILELIGWAPVDEDTDRDLYRQQQSYARDVYDRVLPFIQTRWATQNQDGSSE